MNPITVAVIQMKVYQEQSVNVERARAFIRKAAERGAQLVLLPELFEHPYFCKDQKSKWFKLAHSADGHPMLSAMAKLAAELEVVLPVSFFEKAGAAFFNSLAVIDTDGSIVGIYRKAHIPDGPGYQEKFYFSPGDYPFRTFPTAIGRMGPAICWDQWFPETARVLALLGAEILLFPSAIGSEPEDPSYDSSSHWRRVMQGHAAANMIPLLAANRTGAENGESCTINFYGSSFILDHTGAVITEAERETETILTATIDLAECTKARIDWGLFRDRRPDLYNPILSFGCKPYFYK